MGPLQITINNEGPLMDDDSMEVFSPLRTGGAVLTGSNSSRTLNASTLDVPAYNNNDGLMSDSSQTLPTLDASLPDLESHGFQCLDAKQTFPGMKRILSPQDHSLQLHDVNGHNDEAEEAESVPRPETPKEVKALNFPDGGLRAWLVVSGSFWSMFWSIGYVNSFGVLEAYYLETMLPEYSSSAIAWISSLQYFFVFFMGIITGRLFDAGLFKVVMGFGILLFVTCQMMVSLSTTYWQLILSQGIGSGIGFGTMFSMATSVPAHWFYRRRGIAFGVATAGSSIGGVVCPIWIQRLIPLIGFPWTMRVVGFSALLLLVYAWIVMSTRLPPPIDLHNGGWKRVRLVELEAFKVPAYGLFVLGSMLVLLGLYTPFTYSDVWTEDNHIPAKDYFLSILNGASVFGRIIPGILADRFGKMNMLVPHLGVCVILLFVFPLCQNLHGMIVFSILFGYSSGCFVSLMTPVIAQLGSTSSVGTRLGMCFAFAAVGGLFGTPVSGAILGQDNNQQPHLRWWPTMAFAGVTVAMGWLATVAARQFALRSWSIRGKI
ncbi:unnamed protein product [Sympodiomycopsis kandeliae]